MRTRKEKTKKQVIKAIGNIFPKPRIDAKKLKEKAERKLKEFRKELARKSLEAGKQDQKIFVADFLEELRARLTRSHRDQHVPNRSVKRLVPFLPYFDWRLAGIVPPVRNQNRRRNPCNKGCWAYTATEVFESRLMYNLNRFKTADVPKRVPITHVAISVQSVLDCLKKGKCEPGGHWDAFNHFVGRGATVHKLNTSRIDDNRDEIGKKRQCKAHHKTATRAVAWCFVSYDPRKIPSVRRLKEALLEHGPLIVWVTVPRDDEFQKYARLTPGGIFPQSGKKSEDNLSPNHTVLLTGWHDKKKAWIIQNQFGEDWGISCITRESVRIRPRLARRLNRHGGCMFIRWGANDVGKFASWIEAPVGVRFANS